MDELHAAIAARLRRQRRQVAEDQQRDNRSLAIWRERCDVPRCRYCGAPVDDDGGLFELADSRARRACHLHYAPF